MEPAGTEGSFGYSGRDSYTEVGGNGDIVANKTLPAGTCFHAPRGATIHLHTCANNFLDTPKTFHHAVRLLYW